MEQPLVSIALCTYNGEKFLREQLDTLVHQTYPNLEIIAVDDCSKDDTVSILKEYQYRFSFVKIYQNEKNLGFAKNFEKAILLCSGDLISLSDQDDVWSLDKISILTKNIGDNILVYHDSALIDDSGELTGKKISDKFCMFSGNDARKLLFFNCVSGHAMLFKKALVPVILPFHASYLHDWWIVYLAANVGNIMYLPDCLIRFRQHINSQTDFTNAKIVIDETTWVGQVEVHLKTSDWNVHQHQKDNAYDNVILHVVWEHDTEIATKDGTNLPTLILKGKVQEHLFDNYENLINSVSAFPCENQLKDIDSFVINGFLSRVLVERLAQKSEEVFERLAQLNGNWDETFYHFMAKNFGFKVNALPMQVLAQSLPQTLFAKHKDQSLHIDALIFGQAGFLSQSFEDDYPNRLRTEYDFLKKKYGLTAIDISLWKFLRMRPQNFPTLRLAQFAALVAVSNHLFSKILEVKNVKDLRFLFENLPVNPFWQTHYHFNKEAEKVSLQLGKSSIDNILI
ncbi:MAG: DUF2851 family protein, partial [Sphingobacteriaceae bacterium]